MLQSSKTACVAGATGYLGRHLVAELLARGYRVRALVRPGSDRSGFCDTVDLVAADPTAPETLPEPMKGADLVISALGLTPQTDRLSDLDVEYQANLNLLKEAVNQGVGRFAYVHVPARGAAASDMAGAQTRFVRTLRTAPVTPCVIRPNGFYSDMENILGMARRGRVWLIGDGQVRINPIDGRDLARAVLDSIEAGIEDTEIGGPQILSLNQIADLAFLAMGKSPKVTHLPLWLGKAVLCGLKRFAPQHVWGQFEFFLASGQQDFIGPCHGQRLLGDHFRSLCASTGAPQVHSLTSQ